MEPDDLEEKMELVGKSMELYDLGREAFASGSFQKAIELLERSLIFDFDLLTHHVLEYIGQAYCELKEYQRGIVPLAAATTLTREAKAPYLLGRAFFHLRNYDKAKEFANESLGRYNNYEPAKILLEKIKSEEQLTKG